MWKNSLLRLKQHGVETVPAKWTQSRVKYLGTYVNGYPFKPQDWGTVGRPILRIQDLSSASREPNRYDGEIPSRYLVDCGDILISWSASLGVYRWDGERAWLNQHIFRVVLDKKQIRDDFFVWLAEWFINEMDREVHGSTMQHLTADAFGGFPVLVPPLDQQARIAKYLDHETARTDALVAANERVLALLADKRQALITFAVTRGIDPNVSLRVSTIPGVEQIPAHWETVRLRYLTTAIEQGWSPKAANYPPNLDEWGVLKLNAVSRSRFDETATKTLPADVEPRADLEICRGDVLVTRSNTPGLVGDACFVEAMRPRLMLSDIIYRLTVNRQLVAGKFLVYFLTIPAGRIQIENDARGTSASMVKISQDHIKNWRIPVPPLNEQHAATDYLDGETAQIDELVTETRATIALLKERRSSLIAAAVTGQIDMEHTV